LTLARAACLALALVHATSVGAQPPARRIVSLAPHLTELAFSAGVGDRLVGTVLYSDYPEDAKKIPQIGDAFRVDFERVLALHPDAVLAWDSGTPVQTIERLESLHLDVHTITTSRLADVSAAVRRIGEIAGAPAQAERSAAEFDAQIAALRAARRERREIAVFVQVNDRPIYTVNGRHIISEVIELCGGRNVFGGLNELAPVVSMEAVIAANPQVILATDDTVPDAPAHWRRWRHIDAVRTGNVYTLSSDHVARATMRLAEGAREVCRTLDSAREKIGLSQSRKDAKAEDFGSHSAPHSFFASVRLCESCLCGNTDSPHFPLRKNWGQSP
jgi:iron complex transport system substrate-binding protein